MRSIHMRSIHGYLSRRAQARWPGALVSHEDERDWRLERPDGQEPLGLGDSFHEAHQAVQALLAAERARKGAE